MATTTSLSVTATTALPSATSTCGPIYGPPKDAQDVACAIPNTDENSSALKKCADAAAIETFDDECGIYALAFGQSVDKLSQCLQKEGVNPGHIRCNGNSTATATMSEVPSKTGTETESASKTDGTASPTETDSAAGSLKEHSPSKFALSVMGFLVCALTAGVSM